MPSYAEEERQWRDEQLDWLHQHHEQLLRQNELLERQTAVVERISKHTGLIYGLTIAWLVLAGLYVLLLITNGL